MNWFSFSEPSCGQSYKCSKIVIYNSRVVNISNLLVSPTKES